MENVIDIPKYKHDTYLKKNHSVLTIYQIFFLYLSLKIKMDT